ncbi:helix-turn-helix domain-containing protein [Nonomuraea phyllanthi]|uniref:Helix-turn-helix domain-containing protein n=1 Tax=Nonomuraea phyllanthi TaxID=2219224 RepID=A0A5C4WFZ7_9ACTN|nr:helix-turn-helix domain-containing protein [Nonomuraea phyllanthi]
MLLSRPVPRARQKPGKPSLRGGSNEVETPLTPDEVAEMLGLSRPFVARLLGDAEIPSYHLPGNGHRLVRLADVLDFQDRRERRAEGHRRVMEVAEEAELPY